MQPNAANAVNAGENDGTLTANSELMTSREFRKGSSHRHCFGFRHSHLSLSLSLWLRDRDLARSFFFRQGLWTEGLRTPPGQECSNGSLTFFAVVLWRTFSR